MASKCNACWKGLDNEVAFITTCSHIFCEADAEKIFSNDKTCPICETLLSSRSSITGVELVSDDSKALQLCGLAPKDIMEISSKAVSFWAYQKQLEQEYQKVEFKRKERDMHNVEKQYNDKMLEAANQINTLKHKMASMSEEADADKKELLELRDKYAEKTREKRKLAELYDQLKQKYEYNNKAASGSPSFLSEKAFAERTEQTSRRSPLRVAGEDAEGRRASPLGFMRRELGAFSGPAPAGMAGGRNSPNANQKRDRFALLRSQSPPSTGFAMGGTKPSSTFVPSSVPKPVPQSPDAASAFKPRPFTLNRPATPLFAKRAARMSSV
eukprot:TRINITY_DN1324_c0_g1_i3.p1 TRINITY_DN1324_c0_g1~~TRINITY_DN1324_c0_g1_i3.p1  ORF type:complete len:327 (-),score=-22.57 TRINITY_DN1324_c0_g1_i3:40-1020(-)